MKRRDFVLAAPALLATQSALAAAPPPNVIQFGQSASLTGGQAAYGNDVRDGIAAAFAAASKADGGKGPRFELITLDDGGDKDRCKANTKKLIDEGAVSALIGYTSGAGAEAVMPLVEAAQIALLGTASGNMGIRDKAFTTPYHVRAGYDDEYRRLVQYVKDFGMKRLGYVYLKDTSTANSQAMSNALSAVGIALTATVALDRNSTDFAAAARKLVAAKLDCILFTTNSAPIVSIIDQLVKENYTGLYFATSFAGQALVDAFANKGQSVMMTQVMPRPNATAVPLVKRYREELADLNSKARPGFTSLEGYVAGQVAVAAARNALKNGAVSRSQFKSALSGLSLDLGGYKVGFSGTKQGSRYVNVVAIDRYGRIIS